MCDRLVHWPDTPPAEVTPLLSTARRLSGFQRLAAATTLATLLLIGLGGLVRATDSGLACPDWPLCYGKVIPRQADIPPDTGSTLWNVWFEHSHRLVASVIGVLILALAVWAVRRHRRRGDVLWPAVAALVLVSVQAYLGRQVVLGLLAADLVTAHLAMALAVVGCLVYVTVSAVLPRHASARSDRRFARLSAAVAGLAFVQALVGSAVTGHGAGLVYRDFPLMGGAVVPAVTSASEALHVAHRLLAYLLAAAVVWLCVAALRHRRARQAAGAWHRPLRWLVTLPLWTAALVIVQVALGVANLWFELSPLSVVPHLAVASWIWALLVLHAALASRLAAPVAPPPDREPSAQAMAA